MAGLTDATSPADYRDLAALLPPSVRHVLVVTPGSGGAAAIEARLPRCRVVVRRLEPDGALPAADVAEPSDFDAIVLDGVLEDLADPRPLLDAVRPLLGDRGLLVASAPAARNVAALRHAMSEEPDAGRADPMPSHRYTRAELEAVLGDSGYDVTWLRPVRDPGVPWIPLPLDGSRTDATFGRTVLKELTAAELEDLTALDFVVAALPSRSSVVECSVIVTGADGRSIAHVMKDLVAGEHELIVPDAGAGRAAARNHGARQATGRYLVFLDADARPRPGWLRALLAAATPAVAVVGAKQLRADGTVDHAGVAIGGRDLPFHALPYRVYQGAPADAAHVDCERVMPAVAGSGVLVDRASFVDAGGFDEAYGHPDYADADLCLRVRTRGRRVVYAPGSVIDCDGGEREGPSDEDIARFTVAWLGCLASDDDALIRTDATDLASAYGRPASTSPAPSRVVWSGDFLGASGYAEEARSFVLALDQAGRTVQPNPLAWTRMPRGLPAGAARLAELLELAPLRGGTHVVHSPPTVGVRVAGSSLFVEHVRFRRHPLADRHVGRTMFETDRIPAGWVAPCNDMDEIWVPSRFNLETFARSGIAPSKLHVIPGALPMDPFDARVAPAPLPGVSGFVFLSVFAWSWRKGWDVLVRAFAEEFTPQEAVTLLLHVQPAYGRSVPDHHAEIDRYLRDGLGLRLPDGAAIAVRGGWLSAVDLLRLYRAADAFVLPTRGEGFGRPFMEAMATGLPVIGTRWGGQVDFMHDDNAYLIDCVPIDVPPRMWQEFPLFRGHRCAEPSVKHLRELMRRVFEERGGEAAARAARGRQEALDRFAWPRVAAAIAERLDVPLAPRRAARRGNVPRVAVSWEGPHAEPSGIAVASRELCRALGEFADLDVTVRGADETSGGPAPAVHVRHAWPPSFEPPAAGRWVLMQPWEWGSVPREWVDRINGEVDEVWVPSGYVRACFVRSGVDPRRVVVVPQGIDPDRFRPGVPPYPLSTRKGFRFLFVGGTIWRKGPDILLEAYLRAFTPADDVCLVVKDAGADSFYASGGLRRRIRELASDPRNAEIVYLEHELPDAAMPGLYTASHCLVHPYRGEGFGLPLVEAMACGLPVVTTGHGPALELCDPTSAFVLPATEVTLPEPRVLGLETVERPVVAEVDPDVLAETMRFIFEHPAEARERGQRASAYARQRLTWAVGAAVAHGRLLALAGEPPRRAVPAGPPRRRRVSVCMIVRDEAARLPRCLASVRDVADEIVVVDTGSTDGTPDVARAHGAQVFHEPWRDDFGAARNAALARATGDWIFAIDADETLDAGGQRELRRLVAHDALVGFAVTQRSPIEADGARSSLDALVVRLFPNHPTIRYRGRVHERPVAVSADVAFPVETSGIVLHHEGYGTAAVRRRKAERNRPLLERLVEETPDDPFAVYRLGVETRSLGAWKESERLLRRALALGARLPGPPPAYLVNARVALAETLILDQRPAEAADAAREALAIAPVFADAWCALGAAELRLGHADAARDAYRRALACGGTGRGFVASDLGAATWRSWLGLGEAALLAGRAVEAARSLERALALNPGDASIAGLLARVLDDPSTFPAEAPATSRLRAAVALGRGDADAALASLRHALQSGAPDADTLAMAARALRAAGAEREAQDAERASVAIRANTRVAVAPGWAPFAPAAPAVIAARRPRILVVAAYRPEHVPPTGTPQRLAHLLHSLEDLGDVSFFHPWPETGPGGFGDLTAAADAAVQCRDLRRHRSTSGVARSFAAARPESYDVVFFHRLYSVWLAGWTDATRAIVDVDDVPSQAYRAAVGRHRGARRVARWLQYRRVRRTERRMPAAFRFALVCSEADREYLGHPHVAVVPNAYRPNPLMDAAPDAGDGCSLAWVGSLAYPPNLEGVAWFVRAVWPAILRELPDARFRVIGAVGPRPVGDWSWVSAPGVEFVGPVPDVGPFIHSATATVCPLHEGAGTRIKIIESLAFGKPVVSTATGAYGLPIDESQGLIRCDDPAAFADACLRLLRDPGHGVALGAAGRALVRERFSPDVVHRAVAALVTRILDERGLVR